MPSRPASLRLAGPLLAVLSFALFASTLGFDFVHLDDTRYIIHNPHLGQGLDWDTLRWALTTRYFGWWHPLTWISHLLDVRLFGLWAGGHHLTSALLHAASTWLAWTLLLRLDVSPPRAALAVMLFAWHPMRVESVAWVSERKDVLSVFFALLTALAWVRYLERPGLARYLAAAAAFGAALASKVMVVTLPVVLISLEWMLHRRRGARAVLDKVPLLLLGLGAAAAVFVRQRSHGAVSSLESLGLWERLAGVPWGLARYLGKTIWPAGLCAMYPRHAVEGWQVTVGLAVVAAVTAGAAWQWRRGRPSLLVGWAVFLVTLSPVLGVVQAGPQAIADRYTYLGHLALFAGVVLALPDEWFARRGPQLALGALVLALFVRTLVQVQTWRDTEALFAQALAVEPDNPPIQKNIDGLALERLLAANRLQEAQVEAQALLAKWPADSRAWILAGTASAQGGRFDEAMRRFQRALQLEPGNEDAERFLAFAREDAQRPAP